MMILGRSKDAPRNRRVAVLALLGVAVLTLAAGITLAVLPSRSDHSAAATRPQNIVQGPRLPTIRITGASGNVLRCPQGSTPYINISNAFFVPRLTRGTDFVPGKYSISLSGVIANETTSGIVIDKIIPWVLAPAWKHAVVHGPTQLSANSSGKLVIRGHYFARHVHAAAVGATLRWHWARPDLAPCGKRGLIDDD